MRAKWWRWGVSNPRLDGNCNKDYRFRGRLYFKFYEARLQPAQPSSIDTATQRENTLCRDLGSMTPQMHFAEPTCRDGSQAIKREQAQTAERGKR